LGLGMDSTPHVVVLVRVFEDGLSWISPRAYLIIRVERTMGIL
jgi:hypothetical protein